MLSSFSNAAVPAEIAITPRTQPAPARTINLPDAVVYLPAGLEPGKAYPLAAVFTPDAGLNRTLGNWKAVANRFHWILYASKEFSDAKARTAFNSLEARIQSHVRHAIARFPVDRSRVILAGFSGGGFLAEVLNARDPGLARALVIDANGYYAYGNDPFLPLPAGSGRAAVFLYSPADKTGFGWAARADRSVYQAHGWSTLLLTYPGGHVDASQAQYLRSASWIVAQAAWHA